jgi:hypothetical protein
VAPRRVYLHIGAPKTGTTYLQTLLAKNRSTLAAQGVCYPESRLIAHHKPVWDLRGTPPQREGAKGIEGSWQALVDAVGAADSDVVISSEHFVFATDAQVKTALTAFSGEVHVIYTARDLARQIPAVWQERIRNQKSMSYRSFVESVMDRGGHAGRGFWTAQDVAAVLDRWSVGLSPDRIHLVTAPPAGQPYRVLWDRFVSVLGLDGQDFDVDVDGRDNVSLNMTQTELLRRFNERFAGGLSWREYRRLMWSQLDVLSAVGDGRKISLTAAERAFVAEQADSTIEAVVRLGYDVVGELADLRPAAPAAVDSAVGLDPTQLSDGELLDASLDVMHRLLSQNAGQKLAARDAKRHRRRGQATDTTANDDA